MTDILYTQDAGKILDYLNSLKTVSEDFSLDEIRRLANAQFNELTPIPMILNCPDCKGRHIDEGRYAFISHTTHACQHCGFVWKPALVATIGVQFLPGYKND